MLRIWPQVRSIRVSRNYTETNVPDTSPGFELTGIHCIYSPVQRKFPELNSNRSKRDLFLLYTPHCTIFDVMIFFLFCFTTKMILKCNCCIKRILEYSRSDRCRISLARVRDKKSRKICSSHRLRKNCQCVNLTTQRVDY